MPQYEIWVHDHGQAPLLDARLSGTKDLGMKMLYALAARRYPGHAVKKSNDALVVKDRHGQPIATLAIEPARGRR